MNWVESSVLSIFGIWFEVRNILQILSKNSIGIIFVASKFHKGHTVEFKVVHVKAEYCSNKTKKSWIKCLSINNYKAAEYPPVPSSDLNQKWRVSTEFNQLMNGTHLIKFLVRYAEQIQRSDFWRLVDISIKSNFLYKKNARKL